MRKLIQIKASGLKLFPDPVILNFYAKGRVTDTDNYVSPLYSRIYTHNVTAITGINASGKSQTLHIISLSLYLLRGLPITQIFKKLHFPELITKGKPLHIEIIFFDGKSIKKLISDIEWNEDINSPSEPLYFSSEKLYSKNLTKALIKKGLCSDDGFEIVDERKKAEAYLAQDVSIIIAQNNKNNKIEPDFMDEMIHSDFNFASSMNDTLLPHILPFLDKSVDYIRLINIENQIRFGLKFKSDAEEKLLQTPFDLNVYLSSGTVKGIAAFTSAITVLRTGGYYVVDEIEDHFNLEIVSALIRLFTNKKTNPYGATIVFSTHYPEILDRFTRHDNVYITRHTEKGLSVSNLADELKRNDLKRSDVLRSNYLGDTAPSYDAYINLEKHIETIFSGENHE